VNIEQIRMWALEQALKQRRPTWLATFVMAAIFECWARDGSIPPFTEEDQLDMDKWLQNIRDWSPKGEADGEQD